MKNTNQAARTDRSNEGMRMQAQRPTPSLRWSSRSTRPRLVSFSWAVVTPSHRQG